MRLHIPFLFKLFSKDPISISGQFEIKCILNIDLPGLNYLSHLHQIEEIVKSHDDINICKLRNIAGNICAFAR